MPELAFIYPKGLHKAQIVALTFFTFTLATLCYLVIHTQKNLLGLCVAIVLVGGMGFYISFVVLQRALSFTLSQTHIQHHCTKGGWSIPWNRIRSIGSLSVSHEGWQQKLPWIAIKLTSYEPMLNSISFRLASQLLIEQRALLLIGYRYAQPPSCKLEDMLFDDTPYIAESGKIYRGLLAMLANRMTYTRELLGFDVFIDENLLDRSLEDFVGIMRRYLANAD